LTTRKMKRKTSLMLCSVADKVTQKTGIVDAYQNNVYRIIFSDGSDVLRHLDQLTIVSHHTPPGNLPELPNISDPMNGGPYVHIGKGSYRWVLNPHAHD
jgi:hypothetical protein